MKKIIETQGLINQLHKPKRFSALTTEHSSSPTFVSKVSHFEYAEECLMPLCPSCVAEHTEEHYQSSHKPTYVNLNEALHEVKQKCYANIVSLEECNRKNVKIFNMQDEIIRYREALENNIHEQLTECKQEIYVKIETIFQKYEQKLIQEVEEKYQELSVYESEEAETIKEYITEQIEMIYDKIAMLKSDQCLAALIRFYDHEQEEYEEGLKDISEYLQKHRKVGIALVKLNIEAMTQKLENLCEDLLTLSHAKDEREEKAGNIRNSKIKKSASNNALIAITNQKEKLGPRQISHKANPQTGNLQSRNKYTNLY